MRPALLALYLILSGATTWGANPIGLAESGRPLQWPPGEVVTLRLDQGTLGKLTNEQAENLVREAIDAWTRHDELELDVRVGELLDQDVTQDQLEEFRPGSRQGYNAVLFDSDGSFLQALGYPPQVVGLSGIEDTDQHGFITEAYIILNGLAIDGIAAGDNIEVTREEFLGAVVHELGHLLGMGHSDLNGSAAAFEFEIPGYGVPPRESIETMYSYLTEHGATPHLDDLAFLAQLYPGNETTSSTLFGEVRNVDGVGVPGIHVSARDQADPFFRAVGTLSGARSTPTFGSPDAGEFSLPGMAPGRGLTVGLAQVRAGSFPQFVHTSFLNVGGTPVLGLYPGPNEYLSDPETELDTGAPPRIIVPEPRQTIGPIDFPMNNVARDRAIPSVVAKAGGNHTTATAQIVPFPALIEGVVLTADEGEIIMPTGPDRFDDLEDYYFVSLPDERRVRIVLEAQGGGPHADLDLYLFRASTGQLIRQSAIGGSREVILHWNIPDEVLIGVSSYDPGNGPEEIPFRLWIADTEPVRSALTADALERVLTGQRFLAPIEVLHADRRADGVIDGADAVLQIIDPARPQMEPVEP